ncbi:hypothetical protein SO802_006781 [Lithocarpus litseifolius]|uniref:Uncharacterized protein n=1 Tax=Lithocarpus litseifolius TaxID=425828 RepID=A0AAW2DLZ4_9ROSI
MSSPGCHFIHVCLRIPLLLHGSNIYGADGIPDNKLLIFAFELSIITLLYFIMLLDGEIMLMKLINLIKIALPMRVGQFQILTGDEIRDGHKLRTPLNVGREREIKRVTLPIARERELKVDHESETFAGVGLGTHRETLCRW